MRNILVNGRAGFIGSDVAKHFLEKGDNVVIFDNLTRLLLSEKKLSPANKRCLDGENFAEPKDEHS